jgi:HAD superfamily hydrolase (TIGR01549 family)
MKPIRAVTLDCAGTLIDVDWRPSAFACDCAERVGLILDRGHAEATYSRILQTRWRHYQELNLSRDESVLDGFWRKLTEKWLGELEFDIAWTEPIIVQAREDLYGPDSLVFRLYEDACPALDRLRARGLKLAALSNWDYSLHRVLRLLGIDDLFHVVVASLEEGVEKPEPALFRLTLERLGVPADEALHVGDDPLDDVRAAGGADRSKWSRKPPDPDCHAWPN